MIENKYLNITLKINGTGYQSIFYPSFITKYRPNCIYINGIQNYTITHIYYFNELNNIVNAILDNPIDSCNNTFRDCSNIIEIDLSNFDSSNVTSMGWMFYNCWKLSSLIYLILILQKLHI